jgi:hypothetical protein
MSSGLFTPATGRATGALHHAEAKAEAERIVLAELNQKESA